MELSILLVLIIGNGLLSMSEIALVATSRFKLEQAARRGDPRGIAALKIAELPSRFFSTVQVGITLIGVLAGAFGEASFSTDLAIWLSRWESLQPFANEIATTAVVAVITYLSVVVGELVPKRLAMARPERIALAMARPMTLLSKITGPIVVFLTASTNLLIATFRLPKEPAAQISEEEVRSMIKKGAEIGVFHRTEHAVIERVLDLGSVTVKSLMVPRLDVAWIDETDTADDVLATVRGSNRAHFPVCRGGLDKVVGVLHLRDLMTKASLTDPVDLRELQHPPLFVPEQIPVIDLIDLFKSARTHVVFVLDEYGGVEGLVTLNDVMMAIVGHVVHPGGVEEPKEVQRDDGSWLLDGLLSTKRLREIVEASALPSGPYETVAGFVISMLGRIPKVGEHFHWGGYRFEVVDMDGGRVDRVLVGRAPASPIGASEPPPGP